MIRFLFSLFLIFGAAAQAQSLPERYIVNGVAQDDVLNIRSEPNASSDIIGSFGPYTLNVEVTRVLDGWGRVSTGESMGWVSMRYLAPNPVPLYEAPRPLLCIGAEPFWSMALFPRGAEYDAPDTGRRPLTILREDVADNGYLIEAEEGPTLTRTLIVSALPCNDGMSDRDFGLRATLFNAAPDGNSVQSGCCTMQVN